MANNMNIGKLFKELEDGLKSITSSVNTQKMAEIIAGVTSLFYSISKFSKLPKKLSFNLDINIDNLIQQAKKAQQKLAKVKAKASDKTTKQVLKEDKARTKSTGMPDLRKNIGQLEHLINLAKKLKTGVSKATGSSAATVGKVPISQGMQDTTVKNLVKKETYEGAYDSTKLDERKYKSQKKINLLNKEETDLLKISLAVQKKIAIQKKKLEGQSIRFKKSEKETLKYAYQGIKFAKKAAAEGKNKVIITRKQADILGIQDKYLTKMRGTNKALVSTEKLHSKALQKSNALENKISKEVTKRKRLKAANLAAEKGSQTIINDLNKKLFTINKETAEINKKKAGTALKISKSDKDKLKIAKKAAETAKAKIKLGIEEKKNKKTQLIYEKSIKNIQNRYLSKAKEIKQEVLKENEIRKNRLAKVKRELSIEQQIDKFIKSQLETEKDAKNVDLKSLSAKLKKQKIESAILGKKMQNRDLTAEQYRLHHNKLLKSKEREKQIQDQITAKIKSSVSGMKRFTGTIKRAVRKAFSMEKMLNRMAFVITAKLSYELFEKIQRLFRGLIASSIEFQDSMTKVYTLLDQSQKHLKGYLDESVINNMKKYGQSIEETSRAMYDILSARIPANWAGYVLEEAGKAAVAGFSDIKTAGNALTTTLNSFNMEASRAADVSDWLFSIVKYGKTTLAELTPNLGKVTSAANALNISMEEVGAALASMTQTGIKTDVAITSLRQLMLTLAEPSAEAKKVMAKYNIELNTATVRAEGLGYAVKQLIGLTDEEIATMASSRRGFQALAVAMGRNNTYLENYNHMVNRAGVSSKALEERQKSLTFQWKRLQQKLVGVGLGLKKVVIPAGLKLASVIGTLVEGLSNLYTWIGLVVGVTGLIALKKGITTTGWSLLRFNRRIAVAIGRMRLWVASLTATQLAVGGVTAALVALPFIIGAITKKIKKEREEREKRRKERRENIKNTLEEKEALYELLQEYKGVNIAEIENKETKEKIVETLNNLQPSMEDYEKKIKELEKRIRELTDAEEAADKALDLREKKKLAKETIKAIKKYYQKATWFQKQTLEGFFGGGVVLSTPDISTTMDNFEYFSNEYEKYKEEAKTTGEELKVLDDKLTVAKRENNKKAIKGYEKQIESLKPLNEFAEKHKRMSYAILEPLEKYKKIVDGQIESEKKRRTGIKDLQKEFKKLVDIYIAGEGSLEDLNKQFKEEESKVFADNVNDIIINLREWDETVENITDRFRTRAIFGRTAGIKEQLEEKKQAWEIEIKLNEQVIKNENNYLYKRHIAYKKFLDWTINYFNNYSGELTAEQKALYSKLLDYQKKFTETTQKIYANFRTTEIAHYINVEKLGEMTFSEVMDAYDNLLNKVSGKTWKKVFDEKVSYMQGWADKIRTAIKNAFPDNIPGLTKQIGEFESRRQEIENYYDEQIFLAQKSYKESSGIRKVMLQAAISGLRVKKQEEIAEFDKSIADAEKKRFKIRWGGSGSKGETQTEKEIELVNKLKEEYEKLGQTEKKALDYEYSKDKEEIERLIKDKDRKDKALDYLKKKYNADLKEWKKDSAEQEVAIAEKEFEATKEGIGDFQTTYQDLIDKQDKYVETLKNEGATTERIIEAKIKLNELMAEQTQLYDKLKKENEEYGQSEWQKLINKQKEEKKEISKQVELGEVNETALAQLWLKHWRERIEFNKEVNKKLRQLDADATEDKLDNLEIQQKAELKQLKETYEGNKHYEDLKTAVLKKQRTERISVIQETYNKELEKHIELNDLKGQKVKDYLENEFKLLNIKVNKDKEVTATLIENAIKRLEIKKFNVDATKEEVAELEQKIAKLKAIGSLIKGTEESSGMDWKSAFGIQDLSTEESRYKFIQDKIKTVFKQTQDWMLNYKLKNLEKQYQADLDYMTKQKEARIDEVNNTALTEKHKQNQINAINEKYQEEKQKREEKYRKEKAKAEKNKAKYEATIDYIQGLISIWASELGSKGVAGLITAPMLTGILTAFYLAQMVKINNTEFAKGGYTGKSINRIDETGKKPAGIVHEKEFVFNDKATKGNVDKFYAMQDSLEKGKSFNEFIADYIRGSIGKITSNFNRPQLSYATGGYVRTPQTNVNVDNGNIEKRLNDIEGVVSNIKWASTEKVDERGIYKMSKVGKYKSGEF